MAAVPGKLQGFPFPAPPDMEHKMPRRKAPRELTPEDWKNIRSISKRIIYMEDILEHERQDIEQELAVTLWEKSRNFQPRRSSWASFSYIVLENQLKKILRNRRLPSARYNNNAALSLNSKIECTEESDVDSELIEHINCEGLLDDDSGKTEHAGLPLKIDMEEFITSLPDDLQKICKLLRTMCVQNAARKLGISRTTLYTKIKAIKTGMIDSGFAAYF